MKYTRRSFLRKYQKATVEIRPVGSQQNYHARMNDCCKGGMQLMSDCFLEPGSEVVISPGNRLAEILNGVTNKDCPAEVVWCRHCAKGKPNRFLMGVQFDRPLAR